MVGHKVDINAKKIYRKVSFYKQWKYIYFSDFILIFAGSPPLQPPATTLSIWGYILRLLRVKITRSSKFSNILAIIQVHCIFEHGFLLPGVFHKESLVISHYVNDQI